MIEADKILEIIKASEKILVTSHISPDPDAVCSVLLLGLTLKKNFPDKEIVMVLEESTSQDLSFLHGFGDIKFGALVETVTDEKPDLFISVDAAGINRLCRNDFDELTRILTENNTKTAFIDHHPKDESLSADVYFQKTSPANAQLLYELLFDEMKLEKPDGYADITMVGILRDTGRFKYGIVDYAKTFQIVEELINAGASIEELEYKLDRFTDDELVVLQELITNTTVADGYTYSYISDEFREGWDKPQAELKGACDAYTSLFIRNVGANLWGFIVYPESLSDKPSYSASFRSVKGIMDVSELAKKLGGGGHKEAAGAKNIQAESAEGAIKQIEDLLK